MLQPHLNNQFSKFSPSRENRLLYLDLKEGGRQVLDVTGTILKSKPVQVPYKLMGGGIINFFARNTWKAMKAITGSMDWTAEKMGDAGLWTRTAAKEVLLGTGQAVVKSTAWNWGVAVARDIKMNLVDVGVASAKTGLEAARQALKTPIDIIKSPFESARVTIGHVRGALNHLFKLDPMASAEETRKALFAALGTPFRMAAPLITGPLEVLKKAKEVIATGVRSKLQYIMDTEKANGEIRGGGLINTARDARSGFERILHAPQNASTRVQFARMERLQKEQEEKAANDNAKAEAAQKAGLGSKGAGLKKVA